MFVLIQTCFTWVVKYNIKLCELSYCEEVVRYYKFKQGVVTVFFANIRKIKKDILIQTKLMYPLKKAISFKFYSQKFL